MNRYRWAVAPILSLVGMASAMAADMPLKARSAAAAEVFSWTGFYVGGNLGYGWGNGDINGTAVAPPSSFAIDAAAISSTASPRLKPDGFTGGAQVGYNWQTGGAVFGIEADINAFHLRSGMTGTFPFPSTLPGGPLGPPTAFFTTTSSLSTDWLFTGRGRVGWANDHWLLYATGGVAVTNLSVNQSIALLTPYVFNTLASSTRVGWTVGAGFEYVMSSNWSVKGEYQFLDFGDLNSIGVLTPTIAGWAYSNSTHLTANLARIGVNYHFNTPVVAKY